MSKEFQEKLAEIFSSGLAPYTKTERRGKSETPPVADKKEEEEEPLSILRYIRGGLTGNWRNAKKEEAAFHRTKQIQTSSDLEFGGFLIAPEISNNLIEMLRAKTVMRKMGPTILNLGRTNSIRIPTQLESTTAYWQDPDADASITQSRVQGGRLELVLKDLAALCKVPNDLISDSAPAMDTLVKQDIVKVMALAEDLGFLLGGGGQQPVGLYNWPGMGTTTLTAAITADDLLNAMSTIEQANGTYSGWVMHPRSKNTVRQLKDNNGRYIFEKAGTYGGGPTVGFDTLLGLPVGYSTQIPITYTYGAITAASWILLADFHDYVIAQKPNLGVVASTEAGTSFERNQTWFRGVLRVDGAPRHVANFHFILGVA